MYKVLVVRNDKLGDFILALPGFAMLKASIPEVEITALVPEYTAPIARYVPYIDKVIIDVKEDGIKGGLKLADKLKYENFDVVIVLISRLKTAVASFLAKIDYRLSPATKIYQYFYNKKLVQRRSHSIKPEYVYNLDLIQYFLSDNGFEVKQPKTPYLQFDTAPLEQNHRIIIHPGSGGSANNLSLNQYAKLIEYLDKNLPSSQAVKFIISAGPLEEKLVQNLKGLLACDVEVFVSDKGLIEFGKFLEQGYLFIGGSTGPLHIAGALNIKTVGFYPNRRSATSLRWQTLNDENQRLAFSPTNNSENMQDIDMEQVADKIIQSFFA